MEEPMNEDQTIVPTLHGWTPVGDLFPPCTLEHSHILNILAIMTMHMNVSQKFAFKINFMNICGTNVNVYGSLIKAHKIKIEHQTG
jgi:hypothetical protein